jgi:archaeosine synthase alpha-subunit
MFEVTERDGVARVGTLTLGDRENPTPALFHVDHPRFSVKGPWIERLFHLGPDRGPVFINGSGLSALTEVERSSKPGGDPRARAQSFVSGRKDVGPGKVLYLPGTGMIHEFALMAYSGVDAFDSAQLILNARKGIYLTPEGSTPRSEWKADRCHCPGCIGQVGDGAIVKATPDSSEHAPEEAANSGVRQEPFKSILLHNLLAAQEELALIRHAISSGTLRNLVEMRVRSHPELVSVLRYLDTEHAEFFRMHVGFSGGRVIGVSEDSLLDPRVMAYRERVGSYRSPPGDILLLLPCSARKPYSTSRSHRQFKMVTADFFGHMNELIITSPLGLVPRELENFSPAANYDISVTGEWSEREITMVRDMLTDLMEKNEYQLIVNHTPYSFVGEILQKLAKEGTEIVSTVMNGRATSKGSLSELRETLWKNTRDRRRYGGDVWKEGTFANMWTFQFGEGSAMMLEGTSVRGRAPFLKLMKDKGQLAMMVPKAQRISLTLAGGELLATGKQNRVFIENFHPTGDIFAVGITNADEGIRVGDEVVVVYQASEEEEPDIRGVGVSEMAGTELREASRGVGVRLRHRAKRK